MQGDREDQEHVVHVIREGPKQEIRISLSKFKGRTFADVRLFLCNRAGEVVPTRKGIAIPVERLAELEEAVLKLRNAAENATHPF